MQTKATVIEIDGIYATVESERSSACEGCHKAADGGCSVCSMMGSERKIATRALNTAGAAVGDIVLIESSTRRMLWYAVLVFIIPVLLAFAGWGIAALLTAIIWWRIAGALIGFFGTFIGIYFYSRYLKKTHCDVEIVEIVNN